MVSSSYILASATLVTTIAAGPFALVASVAATALSHHRREFRGESSLWERDDIHDDTPLHKREIKVNFKACQDSMHSTHRPVISHNANGPNGPEMTIENPHPSCVVSLRQYNSDPQIKTLQAKQGKAEIVGLPGKEKIVISGMASQITSLITG